MRRVAALCAVAVLAACQGSDRTTTSTKAAGPCQGSTGYRDKGEPLLGDVDGDGREDRVALLADDRRPPRCRHVLVVGNALGTTAAAVEPLDWPGTNPALLLLAAIDARPGLEAVVSISPANVYEPGMVFTVRDGELARMRLQAGAASRLYPELFPLDDEFPAGVDCAGRPGRIVVTRGGLERGGDRFWELTRTLLRASGISFEPVRTQRFRIRVGPEAPRRWPELAGDPFRSCGNLVRSRG
jgi:hypothetical protein